MRADTGEQLYGFHSSRAQRTGSVLKVLTASAAIAVLGADYQITTQGRRRQHRRHRSSSSATVTRL